MNKQATIKIVLSLVNKYATNHKGALFVIVDSFETIAGEYERHYPHLSFKGNIGDKDVEREIDLITTAFDNAIVLHQNGLIFDIGARIKHCKAYTGKGSKHSAALGISRIKGVTAILSSEEDSMIRIFENGKLITEVNPITGKDTKFLDKLAEFVTKPELHILTAGGITAVVIGIANPIFGLITFTGSYVLTKYSGKIASMSLKEFMKTGKFIIKGADKK